MKNRVLFIFLSVLSIYMVYMINTIEVFPMKGMIADFRSPFLSIPASFLFLILGIAFLYFAFKKKLDIPEYLKCPTCKETFTYTNLKDGKCPNCKDIDAIDIEEYYKE